MGALDKVLGQINGLVVKEMKKNRTGDAKKVSFTADGDGERVVVEPEQPLPGRTLPAYLALPLDEYSLLDPRWIARPDPNEPNLFLLKVPLQELGINGVDLRPEVRIRVDVLEDRVLFTADEFAVGGDPRFQENVEIGLTSTLRHKPPPSEGQQQGWGGLGSIFGGKGVGQKQGQKGGSKGEREGAGTSGRQTEEQREQEQQQKQQLRQQQEWQRRGEQGPAAAQQQGDATSVTIDVEATPADGSNGNGRGEGQVGVQPTEGSGKERKPAGQLLCDVKLAMSLQIPYPLSVVPGPLLSLGGSLITKASIKGLLPSFLQLLAIDYSRWAAGQPRRQTGFAGSLLQAPPASTSGTDSDSESPTDVEADHHAASSSSGGQDSEDAVSENGQGANGGQVSNGNGAPEAGKDGQVKHEDGNKENVAAVAAGARGSKGGS